MLTNSDFSFWLSVSTKNYACKPEGEEIKGITFISQQLTVESALKCATQGKVFCYTFQSNKEDGRLSIKDKKKENFISTSTIIYDFDDMKVSMIDYINSIPYKPSFAYPTYSDGKNGFSRFRLAYVFDTEILGENDFYSVYQAIAKANEFERGTTEHGGWDYRNVAQMYYGTTPNVNTYISNNVYSINDFKSFTIPVTFNQASTKVGLSCKPIPNDNNIDKDFLNNLYHQNFETFFKIYFDSYYSNYTQSLETSLTLSKNKMWYEYPDNYVAVFRKREGKKVLKWGIGDNRKIKLYITAQIMLHNCPDLSIENLIYNLVIERRNYYTNSDNKINNQVLVDTAKNAFNTRNKLKPSSHPSYRVNKEFWAELGVGVYQAKGYIRRKRRIQKILPYIDSDKTIKENYNNLIQNGIKLSLRTLQRMVARGDIEINNKSPHTLLSDCHSRTTIRQNNIIELMIENDKITANEIAKHLECDVSTIKRDIKEMRGFLIDRVGNNRSGHWVVHCATEPKDETEFDFFEQSFETDMTNTEILNTNQI